MCKVIALHLLRDYWFNLEVDNYILLLHVIFSSDNNSTTQQLNILIKQWYMLRRLFWPTLL